MHSSRPKVGKHCNNKTFEKADNTTRGHLLLYNNSGAQEAVFSIEFSDSCVEVEPPSSDHFLHKRVMLHTAEEITLTDVLRNILKSMHCSRARDKNLFPWNEKRKGWTVDAIGLEISCFRTGPLISMIYPEVELPLQITVFSTTNVRQ